MRKHTSLPETIQRPLIKEMNPIKCILHYIIFEFRSISILVHVAITFQLHYRDTFNQFSVWLHWDHIDKGGSYIITHKIKPTIFFSNNEYSKEDNCFFRTILSRAWTFDSCAKQQCDVSLPISLLHVATQPWLYEFIDNKICLAFELRLYSR